MNDEVNVDLDGRIILKFYVKEIGCGGCGLNLIGLG
jgi:hypothetical protein